MTSNALTDWQGMVMLAVPVLIATLTLVWVGLRGRHAWASPFCRKCRYDLRGRVPEETPACPECGADLKRKRAIGYVRHRPRWSLVGLGVFVLLSPGMVLAGLYGYERAARAPAMPPAPPPVSALKAKELPKQTTDVVMQWTRAHPDSSSGWNELVKRLQQGTLVDAHAVAALDMLREHMKGMQPDRRFGLSLREQKGFLAACYHAGLIDEDRMRAINELCYGKTPEIRIERVQHYQTETDVEIEFGPDIRFQKYSDLPWRMVWSLHPIMAGDQELEINDRMYFDQSRVDLMVRDLGVGKHKAVFKFEVGLFDEADLIGFNPRETRRKDWPKAMVQWTQAVDAELVIYDRRNPPVTPTTDTAYQPGPANFVVDHAVARYESGRVDRFSRGSEASRHLKAFIKLSGVGGIDIPLAMSTVLHVGDVRVLMGNLTYNNTPDSDTEWELEGIAHRVRDWDKPAKLVLTPNPSALFDDPAVDRCWGAPIVIEGIRIKPLFRDDSAQTPADDNE